MHEDNAYLKRPRIAISAGDPNGIGPEVILKCLSDPRLLRMVTPVIVGSIGVLQEHLRRLDLKGIRLEPSRNGRSVGKPDTGGGSGLVNTVPVLDIEGHSSFEVDYGIVSGTAGALAMKAVEVAVDLCLSREADAMVTAPISKEAIGLGGYSSPGHTDFIAGKCGGSIPTMMMIADRLRVGLVTAHVPLSIVPGMITGDAILEKLAVMSRTLNRDFGIGRPKIAVLGLNPHAGESGILGDEEEEIITPAIRRACEQGYLAAGPFPADGFFGTASYLNYDGVLAMYHDQGLVPFKALAFNAGVNYTAGLDIVRTSPDHGTAFDISGKGKANADSMRSAIYLAIDVARRRKAEAAESSLRTAQVIPAGR
jgi:4-hydroxythreonine-4-phosphate dehydrogenase